VLAKILRGRMTKLECIEIDSRGFSSKSSDVEDVPKRQLSEN